MNQKILSKKTAFFVFGLSSGLIIVCGLFIYSNLRADLLYNQAIAAAKPIPPQELERYYHKALSLLSRAIEVNKSNPDYLAAKADYMLMAIDDNLMSELLIDDSKIEELYKTALKLNPINFEYHLKLGWFYLNRDIRKAEAELTKAAKLYPSDYQPYFYLAQYYLKQKNRAAALTNLFLASEVASRYTFRTEIKEISSDLIGLGFDNQEKKMEFTVYPQTNEFNFKQEGLPQLAIALEFKLYTDNPQAQVSLYKKGLFYSRFKGLPIGPELSVHEFSLSSFPSGTYLDDFIIKTDLGSSIEKLIIRKPAPD